ncbi:MAG: C39 family peptidase [Nanoarchaeota archaeon]|nr:C39 family peptidase [Nanoarchaeota archaeon]
MNIPILKGEGNQSCGITCLRMVLAYYGKEVSQKELEKFNQIREGINHLYDLGYTALKNKFSSLIIGYDFMLFNNPNEENPKEFLKNTEFIGQSKDIKESCLKYLKEGGKLKVKIPSLKDINKYLDKEVPIILGIRAKIIEGRNPAHILHYVILEGYNEETYSIVDPVGKKYKIEKNKLVYAWFSRLGQFLVVES